MRAQVLDVEAAITPEGVVAPAAVHIADGMITHIEPGDGENDQILRGTLSPGFVDLQVNGIGEVDVATAATDAAWSALDAALLDQGVTTWCPTLISRPLADYASPLARITEAAHRTGRHPTIAGAHLEGPFLSVPGAHPLDALQVPDLVWLRELPDIVRVVTLAPELRQGLEAVEVLARRGVLVAIGHTAADAGTVEAAAERGARLMTHVFNAMTGIHHRAPGPAAAALVDDRLTVSIIADGVHVDPLVIDLIRRAKGNDGCVLVTDQVAAPGDLVASDAPRTAGGKLAGSRLRMDQAVANAVRGCGFSIEDAVHAAATRPAELLGLTDRGALAPGLRADLVLLDAELHATHTWLAEDWQ